MKTYLDWVYYLNSAAALACFATAAHLHNFDLAMCGVLGAVSASTTYFLRALWYGD